jgi:hypothetical protein
MRETRQRKAPHQTPRRAHSKHNIEKKSKRTGPPHAPSFLTFIAPFRRPTPFSSLLPAVRRRLSPPPLFL